MAAAAVPVVFRRWAWRVLWWLVGSVVSSTERGVALIGVGAVLAEGLNSQKTAGTNEELAKVAWLDSNPVCFSFQMEVQAPPGTTIGHVLQTWHPFLPKFSILDADRQPVLRVVGPCWTCGCGTDTNFEVL